MPLSESCSQFLKRLLYVNPIPAFGWEELRSPVDLGKAIDLPCPFYMELVELCFFQDRTEGGIGIISDTNHELNGEWVGFCLRSDPNEFLDFGEHIGAHNLRIGSVEPRIEIDRKNKSMPEWIVFDDFPICSGIALIGDSPDRINSYRRQRSSGRRNPEHD